MTASRIFVARLVGCSVFDPLGDRVGKVRDALVVYRTDASPRVVGLIVEIPGRKRIFLSIGRVTSIASGQVLTTGIINMRRFEQRGGEVRVVAEMLGRTVQLRDGSGSAVIEDVAISQSNSGDWEVSQLFCRRPKTASVPFARGTTLYVPWDRVTEKKDPEEAQSASQLIASLGELPPADLASALRDLSPQRMIEVAEELPDARLADVLEEMQDEEQRKIIGQLDDDRAADVLDQMQPDDAADLIAQLPEERVEHLLELMQPEEAEDVRLLLRFDQDTAGGLMTTEPIIVSAEATVAEGLALIRRHELAPALGASICVTLPPYEAPTGRYLGLVHFQKMLRYPPSERLGTLVDTVLDPVTPETSLAEVSRILASYNLVSVPVVDANHRLLGVVTIDDVLDHLLPDDWRTSGEHSIDTDKPEEATPQTKIDKKSRGGAHAT